MKPKTQHTRTMKNANQIQLIAINDEALKEKIYTIKNYGRSPEEVKVTAQDLINARRAVAKYMEGLEEFLADNLAVRS